MNSIPIIDISPLACMEENNGDSSFQQRDAELSNVIREISQACQSFGFFVITNHGVSTNIISEAWHASREFFDLDPPIKSSVSMSREYPYGYENSEALGAEISIFNEEGTANQGKKGRKANRCSVLTDSKETFAIGPINPNVSGMPARIFPSGAPINFAPALTQYFSAMEKLARMLFRGFALALGLVDPSWFLREGLFDEGHQCALRILNYPEIEIEDGETDSFGRSDDFSGRPEMNDKSNVSSSQKIRVRAGAHTDYGAFTILKSGGPGLQLNLGPFKSSERGTVGGRSHWVNVPHLIDSFIINLGDLMQRWTNDRWRSTLHRVVALPSKDWCEGDNDSTKYHEGHIKKIVSARRQSMAFFVNMNGNAEIIPFDTCLNDQYPSRYHAIKASEYLIQRHELSMGIQSNIE